MIFSIVVLSAINIAISGHLLGYVFDLSRRGENEFNLRFPPVFRLTIRGETVIAGFLSFAISLIVVGIWLSDGAQTIFIHHMGMTDSKAIACQALAATISCAGCMTLLGIRSAFRFVTTSIRERAELNDRVDKLINDKGKGNG